MTTDKLQIGNVIFQPYDLPEEVALGGQLLVNVRKYPGGKREVQVFGAQDDPITWSGTLNFNGALQRAKTLDAMWRSGKVWTLRVGGAYSGTVVITKFNWKYQNAITIPYDIELEVAPKTSVIAPAPTAQPTTTTTSTGQTVTLAPTKPASNSAKGQRIHIVKEGETLSGIAKQYYGDPSQYRKIVSANPIIKNPNAISTGWKLVIP